MTTNVGKSKIEADVGPASITVSIGKDNELEVGSFAIMNNGEIKRTPLIIGDLKSNVCIIDDKGNCYREVDGKKVPVNPDRIDSFKSAAKEQARLKENKKNTNSNVER